jgi:two-component system C4-dicarboxylate transport sensor histidine kinase DctB
MPINVARAVEETIALFRPQFEREGITVKVNFTARNYEIAADENGLRQVLVNIVKNSTEALARKSGVKLIEIRTSAASQNALIEIGDNGPGIPKEIIGTIFSAFVSSGKNSGVGIGLAVSREIMRVHGGEITAMNQTLGGALFRLEFPLWSVLGDSWV